MGFNSGFKGLIKTCADSSGRAVEGVVVRSLASWDCGFESHRQNGCLPLVKVVCGQTEHSVTGRSLVQKGAAACCVSECGREDAIMRRLRPL